MKRVEVIDILEHLQRIYPKRFEADQKMVEAWYFHLKSHDKEAVLENILQYARNNRFPPTIADLVYQGHRLTDFDYKRVYYNGED